EVTGHPGNAKPPKNPGFLGLFSFSCTFRKNLSLSHQLEQAANEAVEFRCKPAPTATALNCHGRPRAYNGTRGFCVTPRRSRLEQNPPIHAEPKQHCRSLANFSVTDLLRFPHLLPDTIHQLTVAASLGRSKQLPAAVKPNRGDR